MIWVTKSPPPLYMNKISLGTIFIGRAYCLDDYLDFVASLDEKIIEPVWIIRSGDEEYVNYLTEFAKNFKHYSVKVFRSEVIDHNLHTDFNNQQRRIRIAESYKLLYRYAKEMGNDLFVVEDDVIPPKNALNRLCELREKNEYPNAIAWAGIARSVYKGGYDWYPVFIRGTIKYFQEIAVNHGGIKEVNAVGMGCILIDKEFFNYDYDAVAWARWSGQDQGFGKFIFQQGKTIVCDLDLRCNHYTLTPKGNPMILKEFGGKWFKKYVERNK